MSIVVIAVRKSLHFRVVLSIPLIGVFLHHCGSSVGSFSMQARIDTVGQRKKLPISSKNRFWTAIGDGRSGLKLGYRRGARGGVWVGKLVMDSVRVETTLGAADDGSGVGMSHAEAMQAALAWAGKERTRLAQEASDENRDASVADAIATYVKMRIKRAERAGRDAETDSPGMSSAMRNWRPCRSGA